MAPPDKTLWLCYWFSLFELHIVSLKMFKIIHFNPRMWKWQLNPSLNDSIGIKQTKMSARFNGLWCLTYMHLLTLRLLDKHIWMILDCNFYLAEQTHFWLLYLTVTFVCCCCSLEVVCCVLCTRSKEWGDVAVTEREEKENALHQEKDSHTRMCSINSLCHINLPLFDKEKQCVLWFLWGR